MKLFLDRHKTLLPRIDVIYLLTRILVLICITWYLQFTDFTNLGDNSILAIISTYTAILFIFYLSVKNLFDIKLSYLSTIVFDIILIPLLILNTGGITSSFYPLFFVVVSVATYILTFWFSLAVTVLVAIGFLAGVSTTFTVENIFSLSIQLGFIWVYYFAIFYASDYMRKSENRLLKLFNTLNMRTSELEKSQALLEIIYENTRRLISFLDPNQVIEEVIRLTGKVLQYESSSMIFKEKGQNLYYRARYSEGQSNFHPKALDESQNELIHKVFKMGQEIIIKDTVKRDDFVPLNKMTRSAVIVPITSHGKTSACLIAESKEPNCFNEKDIQVLTAIARSAALALENAELHKRTEELTVIDELTMTYNYRYFVKKLQEEKRRAARYNLPLSLIMVDIDWFKKLNDNYGHEIGNKVLKQLSSIIKRCIRDVDIFARYGGEEFVVILPQTPERDASVIGERIRSQVEKEIFRIDGKDIKTTVSVGLSSYPENGHSEEELVSVADQALYRAKGEGRNLVCVK